MRRQLLAVLALISCAASVAQEVEPLSFDWTPPTQREDGSALDGLSGYRLYATCDNGDSFQAQIQDGSADSYILTNAPADVPCEYGVTSVDLTGLESRLSNVVIKTAASTTTLEAPGADGTIIEVEWTSQQGPPTGGGPTVADFNVQRGTVSLSAVATATITAGVDYTAPASTSAAFIRLVGHHAHSQGVGGDFASQPDRNLVRIQNPDNLLTDITFERDSATNDVVIEWEIVEYVGAPGGANEFIVRDVGTLDVAANSDTTVDTSAVADIGTDADVLPFVTGTWGTRGGRSGVNEGRWSAEWLDGTDVARFTRGGGTLNNGLSYAIVEFTGSNWTVARYSFQAAADNTAETQTITSVGAISRAFLVVQGHADAASSRAAHTTELTDVDELTHLVRGESATTTAVTWVVSNSDTGAGAMNVQRAGAVLTAGGGNPQSETVAITAVDDLAEASIMGVSGYSEAATADDHQHLFSAELTAVDEVTINAGADAQDLTVEFEVVEWPATAAAATDDVEVALQIDVTVTPALTGDVDSNIASSLTLTTSAIPVLTAAGSVVSVLDVGTAVAAALTGGGQVSAALQVTANAVAQLSAEGRLDTALALTTNLAALLQGQAGLTADLSITGQIASILTADGTLASTLLTEVTTTANVNGAANNDVAAAMDVVLSLTPTLQAGAPMAAALDAFVTMAANVSGPGGAFANLPITTAIVANTSALASMDASLALIAQATANLNARGEIAAGLLGTVAIAGALDGEQQDALLAALPVSTSTIAQMNAEGTLASGLAVSARIAAFMSIADATYYFFNAGSVKALPDAFTVNALPAAFTA